MRTRHSNQYRIVPTVDYSSYYPCPGAERDSRVCGQSASCMVVCGLCVSGSDLVDDDVSLWEENRVM